MLKLNLQYFGYLMWRANSLEKTLMLGKIEGRKRGHQRMRWMESITDAMDMNLGKLWEMVRDCSTPVHGVAKSQTQLGDWTTTTQVNKSNIVSTRRPHLHLMGPLQVTPLLPPTGGDFHLVFINKWTILFYISPYFIVVQSLSHVCYPMDYSMPDFPVLHCPPEFAQIHASWVSDAIYLILCCLLCIYLILSHFS